MRHAFLLGIAALFPVSAMLGAQSSHLVNIKYDKFEDITEISTSLLRLGSATGRKQEKQDLRLQAVYMCTGETSHCSPTKVQLRFVSYSVSEHIHSHLLILLCDGARIRLEPKWTGAYEGTGPLTEHIDAVLTLQDFLRIARAQGVEGKLGETTFHLSEENLTAIHELANEMSVAGEHTKNDH